ncbi:hypothetical protein L227DRAFT_618169 [Lentinus tigrinus ALCF2SS1-6]|nr:hypothetical protein L227DRAFT_618169 [Lentinus tigrinus ALCF2SS1-6]
MASLDNHDELNSWPQRRSAGTRRRAARDGAVASSRALSVSCQLSSTTTSSCSPVRANPTTTNAANTRNGKVKDGDGATASSRAPSVASLLSPTPTSSAFPATLVERTPPAAMHAQLDPRGR